MTYAQYLPSTIGSGSSGYQTTFTASSSRSVGVYRPSPTDFINSFYAVLRRWESDTAFVSDPDVITNHPSFLAMVENAELVVDLIIEELRQNPSMLVWVLDDAYGELPYSPAIIGNITEMSNAWIAWADRNDNQF